MGIFGIGTETFLCINGLVVSKEISLSNNKKLLPAKFDFSAAKILKHMRSDIDAGIALIFGNSITAQLKITADNHKKLAVLAWNAQWDLVLLSAIFNCEAICNIQCSHYIENLDEISMASITNYHMRGLVKEPYIVTEEDTNWLKTHFLNAQDLLNNNKLFETAIHSMSTYRWHSLPRVQLAVLWAGIESLFCISNELNFRISLYIAKFLSPNDNEKARELFNETITLYKTRSSAVHGSKLKGDINQLVTKSASLLHRLIIECIVQKKLPKVDELIFT